MKRILLFSLVCCGMAVANAQSDVLQTARKTNDYFMQKYSDPTEVTFVHNKKRPSSLWTRAVYYEGLMALHAIALSSVIWTIQTDGHPSTNGSHATA